MRDSILISVVVPSYNRADLVGQAIDSILAQKVNANIEIVIGDDCSKDNSREVLLKYKEHYPDNIHLIFHKHNVGLGANWAFCVKACKGKYICNCDNDDYWHNPDKLQIQLEYMENRTDCNVCITNYRTHNCATGKFKEEKARIAENKDVQQAMWCGGRICNATIMYRADFLKTHIDLEEFIRRRLSLQDWPTWVILAAYTKFDILPVSTATVGIETVSITRPESVTQLARRYDSDKDVCRYLGELFPDKFPFDEHEWDRYVAGRLLATAYVVGDFESAKYYCQKYPSGVSKLKTYCAKLKWTFLLFRFCKSSFYTLR